MPLSPDQVLDAAQALIDEEGLDALTMRRLAARLEVNPMTIYLRFANKEELVDRLLERALLGAELGDIPDGTWTERAAGLARAVRAHLLTNRQLMPALRSSPRITMALFQAAEVGLPLMAELGFDEAEVVRAFRALLWNTIGLTLVHDVVGQRFPGQSGGPEPAGQIRAALEQVPDAALPSVVRYLPHLGSFDEEELFEYTTGLLVAGLWSERRTA